MRLQILKIFGLAALLLLPFFSVNKALAANCTPVNNSSPQQVKWSGGEVYVPPNGIAPSHTAEVGGNGDTPGWIVTDLGCFNNGSVDEMEVGINPNGEVYVGAQDASKPNPNSSGNPKVPGWTYVGSYSRGTDVPDCHHRKWFDIPKNTDFRYIYFWSTGDAYKNPADACGLRYKSGGTPPPNTFTLSVTKDGTGSGTVTSSEGSINCGPTCSATYPSGTAVTLTATPASGSVFAGWSGACSGTGSCDVTMGSDQSVNATFNVIPPGTFTLSVTKDGTGSGTVTSSEGSINCGPTCSATYPSGTAVTLTATPASGSVFAGWSGACSGTGSCDVTMGSDQSVNATFILGGSGGGGGGGTAVSPPACPLSPSTPSDSLGRTIVNFSDAYAPTYAWMGTKTNEPHSQKSQAAALAAGNYRITLAEWDDHTGQQNCVQSGQCPASYWQQPNERYHLNLVRPDGSAFGSSGDTTDLADDQDLRSDVVNQNILLPDLGSVQPFHSEVVPDDSNSNSIVAICATFDLLAPPSINILAQPGSVQTNGVTTVSWTSQNADSCSSSQGSAGWPLNSRPVNGSWQSGPLSQTSTYVLTCAGPGGSTSANTTVTVGSGPPYPPVTVTLNANPSTVPYLGATTLNWTSVNATNCVAYDGSIGWPGSKDLSGSWQSGPLSQDTTYTLGCANGRFPDPIYCKTNQVGPNMGSCDFKSVTVTVAGQSAGPSLTFSANPTSVPLGGKSTLSWTSINTSSCIASQGSSGWPRVRPTNGSWLSGPLNVTTLYTLTCIDAKGNSVTKNATVTISSLTFNVVLKANAGGDWSSSVYGAVPLNNVSLRAIANGSATGPINYVFDCGNGQAPINLTDNTNTSPYTKDVPAACNYPNEGTYTANVVATRNGIVSSASATVIAATACPSNLSVRPPRPSALAQGFPDLIPFLPQQLAAILAHF